ncbi:protein FAM228A [Ctenodactylus gundi]
MAATKAFNYHAHFRPEKLREWPEPESVSLMEALAREDIDEAVHTILFRENYIVKRLDAYLEKLDVFKKRRKEMLHKKWAENVAVPLQQRIMEKVTSHRAEKTKQENFDYYLKPTNKMVPVSPFSDPVFRRQKDKEKRSSAQDGTGKRCSTKELKDLQKTGLHARGPRGTLAPHSAPPNKRRQSSARPGRRKTCSACSPENVICADTKCVCGAGKMASDPSELAFERQFRSSRLSPRIKEAARKGSVTGTRELRPRSWAAGDCRHRWAPVERRVMTAEVLGKHLASLKVAARPQLASELC